VGHLPGPLESSLSPCESCGPRSLCLLRDKCRKPSIKPELKTRVTAGEKQQFDAAAQANGLTDSRLLEKLVPALLKGEPIASPAPASQVGGRSQRAHARLTPAEHADLGRLAAERGMSRRHLSG